MKKFIMAKKAITLLATLVAVAVGAFGAYAYFTASGSGTGQQTVGSASTITLSSSTGAALYPAGGNVAVTVGIANPGSGGQFVNVISGSVATDTNGTAGTTADDCLGSWFEVDPVTYANTVAAGGTASANTVVRMNDSGTNQNACQGDSLTINWSSN
jgi:hypothetical protein